MTFVVVFVTAFAVGAALTPRVIAWSRARGVLDVPLGEAKEVYVQPTPHLGGLAIFRVFVLAVMVAWVLPIERRNGSEAARSVGLLAGAVAIFPVGCGG